MAEISVQRRAELGLTQEEALERTDPPIGITTIRQIEKGDQQRYRPTSLASYSKALDWPPSALWEIAHGADRPDGEEPAVMARLMALEVRMENQEQRLLEVLRRLDEVASTLPS